MRSSWLALVFLFVAVGRVAPTQSVGAKTEPQHGWHVTAWRLEDATARPELPSPTQDLDGLRGSDPRPAGQDWQRRHEGYGAGFALPELGSLDPSLEADPPELIRLEGQVLIPTRGHYRFGLEANTRAIELFLARDPDPVILRGAEALQSEWIELGPEDVVLVGASALRPGAAELQLVPRWERRNDDDRGFRSEPIPPASIAPVRIDRQELDRLFERPESARVPNHARSAGVTIGQRVRFGQLGCLNCHAAAVESVLPTLTRRAPDLAGIGERVHGSWLAEWIANPQASKPGAGMPDLFEDSPDADADLEALLAYLLAGADPEDSPIATEMETRAQGRALYHTLGCIACHGALDSPAEVFGDDLYPQTLPDVDVAAPFAALHEKWRPRALSEFLQDPRANWHDSPMPSLDLSAEEADLIATYLLGRTERHAPEARLRASAELVERGRAVFEERRCANCHTAPDASERTYAAPTAPPLPGWRSDRGCLDPTDATSPRYVLSATDRAAIARVWSQSEDEPSEAPLERARRTYASLNCQACHARDGDGGLPDELRPYFVGLEESAELGDEARIPPELSGVGRKLTTPWLEEVLTNSGRARPYMAARMPQFAPDEVRPLAHGLAYQDGVFPHTDRDAPAVTDEQVLAGKRLMGIRGLACISCHVVGDLPPAGTPGPDMTQFAARLRYDWFRDYMHDPARFKPGTRMPQFTTKGQSAIRDLWDGDAERQIDAMWAYFSLGEFLPVPEGVPKPGELALVPDDRPVVFRTFLESVGSRAICVGTPSGLHYAFDAEKVRLAEVWKGDFVDASANWTARGGGEASGRGEVIWQGREAMPMRIGTSKTELELRGYRLDPEGAPTFIYDLRAQPAGPTVRVEESIFPYPRPGILFGRLFAVHGLPAGDRISLPVAGGDGITFANTPLGDILVSSKAADEEETVDLIVTWIANIRGTTSRPGLEDLEGVSLNDVERLPKAAPGLHPLDGAEPMIFSIEVAE